MRKINVFVMVMVAVGMIVTSCGKGYNSNVSLKSDVDSVYYAVGVSWGAGLREQMKTLPGVEGKENYDAIIAGFATAMNDEVSKLKITPEEAQAYIQTYIMGAQAKDAEKGKAEGEAFLAANKTKEGVITTELGLQYKVLTEGTGRRPTEEDKVIVHYVGKFLDGSEFDSSKEEPVTFPITGVIRGWTLGLQIMPVGSKYILWIPSDLAYGEQGIQDPQTGGWFIRPNSVLEFEVELLGIEE